MRGVVALEALSALSACEPSTPSSGINAAEEATPFKKPLRFKPFESGATRLMPSSTSSLAFCVVMIDLFMKAVESQVA
jgi:hypothetical protein